MTSPTASRDPPKPPWPERTPIMIEGGDEMVATKTPPRPLSELEQAEAAVAAAVQKAEQARVQAEAARQAAQLRQEARQRQWADREVAANVDQIKHHAKTVGMARAAFEQAAIDDPAKAVQAFTDWTAALAARHAAEGSHDVAMSVLGRTARVAEWPVLSFAAELDAILARHTDDQLDDAIETERARRLAAFTTEAK